MILIYSDSLTERLSYVAHSVFTDRMGLAVILTDDAEELKLHQGVRINYSYLVDLPGIRICPAGLIAEKGIREQQPNPIERNGLVVLFPVASGDTDFDVFSAIFFMLSRYEEYLPFTEDMYGRFGAEESLAFRVGFLQVPVVDRWIIELKELISHHHPELKFKESSYRYLSTIDIDNAFAYRHKGFFRTLGGFGRDLLKGEWSNLKRRIRVLLLGEKDPYDTFSTIEGLHESYKVKPIFFFLLADYGHNDKSIPFSNGQFQSLVKSIADEALVGIHPGFMSNFHQGKLPVEVARLQELTHREVIRSRQHYLMLKFPETYRRLIDAGIREEHSMGFASHTGFRAGTSMPFMFYDLDREASTPLKLVPFAAMDATLKRYMGLSREEALEDLKKLREAVREVNGQFVTLWHNESLGEIWEWEGWSSMYEEVLKLGTDSVR